MDRKEIKKIIFVAVLWVIFGTIATFLIFSDVEYPDPLWKLYHGESIVGDTNGKEV